MQDSTMRFYNEFAEFYDQIFVPKPKKDSTVSDPELQYFLVNLFLKYRAQKILDCACGTGYPLLDIIQTEDSTNWEITATDGSEKMINLAKKKHTDLKRKKLVHSKVSFRQIVWNKIGQRYANMFDITYCLGNSFLHLPRDNHKIALRSMINTLKNGGIFLIDNPVYFKTNSGGDKEYWRTIEGLKYEYDEEDDFKVYDREAILKNNKHKYILYRWIDYDHSRRLQKYDFHILDINSESRTQKKYKNLKIKMHILRTNELACLLEEVGFHIQEITIRPGEWAFDLIIAKRIEK